MAKKLTVEVDADVSKAKQKLGVLEQGVSTPPAPTPPISPAADGAAKSLDAVGRSARNLSEAAEKGSYNLKGMTKVFGGMAVRMATTYAASNMAEGSAGQKVVGVAGDVFGGAMTGSAFGPIGALVGGITGLTSALMADAASKRAENESIRRTSWEFDKSEHDYASAKEFDKKLKDLTSVGNGVPVDQQIAALSQLLDDQKRIESEMIEKIKGMIKSGDMENAGHQRVYLNELRSRMSRVESAKEALEGKHGTAFRTSTAGTDAIQRIGGDNLQHGAGGAGGGGGSAFESQPEQKRGWRNPNAELYSGHSFGFSVPVTPTKALKFGNDVQDPFTREMRDLDKELLEQDKLMNKFLEQISENTKKTGGAVWQ